MDFFDYFGNFWPNSTPMLIIGQFVKVFTVPFFDRLILSLIANSSWLTNRPPVRLVHMLFWKLNSLNWRSIDKDIFDKINSRTFQEKSSSNIEIGNVSRWQFLSFLTVNSFDPQREVAWYIKYGSMSQRCQNFFSLYI